MDSTEKMATLAAAIAVLMLVAATHVLAQHRDRERGDERKEHWRGHEIRKFHEHDLAIWRRGHWVHGDHDGRLGWWWVAAGMWYFYPAPVRPYPDPYAPPPPALLVPPMVAPAPPPAAPEFWYYCGSLNSYYPYVAACPEGWRKVPAQSPEAPR